MLYVKHNDPHEKSATAATISNYNISSPTVHKC